MGLYPTQAYFWPALKKGQTQLWAWGGGNFPDSEVADPIRLDQSNKKMTQRPGHITENRDY